MRTPARSAPAGRTPPAYKVVFVLLAANFVVGYALSAWAWQAAPDARHPYGILYRGGSWRYYAPGVGWWVEHWLWLHFALMAAAALVLWRHRDKLQKPARDSRPDRARLAPRPEALDRADPRHHEAPPA
jgi:hypothetical protein